MGTPLQWLLIVVLLDLMLILILLLWRWVLRTQSLYKNAFIKQWRLVLMAYAMGQVPSVLPVLKSRDHSLFFMLWNDTQQQLVGSASPRLNQLMQDLQLVPEVIRRLRQGNLREQMVACQTVGHLETLQEAWPLLVHLAFEGHTRLAFFALQALIQMSPEAALPVLLDIMSTGGTARARLLGLFRRYPSGALVEPLLGYLQEALYAHDLKRSVNIIALLEVLPFPSVLPTMRQILVEATDPELIVSCLRVMTDLHDPWCLGLSLPYLTHPDWRVRQHAMAALGKVAQVAQIPSLLKGLEDESPWVAQAALESLWQLPGLRREKLLQMSEEHGDPVVRERLQQFFAEQQVFAAHA
jgi:hypothetical protein